MTTDTSDATQPPYAGLTPDTILDAFDSLGLRSDGRLLALNSYENRVYQVGIEDEKPLIAKFYRPERWSDEAIMEEHAFAAELADHEVPIVGPLEINGSTLHRHGGFRFAVYPRQGGRTPEFADEATLEWMGRFIGRIHLVGQTAGFRHRGAIDIETFGQEPRDYLWQNGVVPASIREVWYGVTEQALQGVARCYQRAGDVNLIRVHGDCHAGNVLWTDHGPHFVDLDDCRMAPAIQDLWMLLSGQREEMQQQIVTIICGYEDFVEFDPRELHLVEALRTLRLLHYSAWLARRWDDPAFPAAFPWFGTQRYWEERILELREQIAAMDETPLIV
ncbi:MAG: serine/threonine protein kinase [Gammaproteobacteria bacterium]|nr:serine/threonine protein kinase [Gammaproteobacteria bacterium]